MSQRPIAWYHLQQVFDTAHGPYEAGGAGLLPIISSSLSLSHYSAAAT